MNDSDPSHSPASPTATDRPATAVATPAIPVAPAAHPRVLGLIDGRTNQHHDALDPWQTRVLGVPLALWAVRALRLVLPADAVKVAADDENASTAERFGIGVLPPERADEMFALAMSGRSITAASPATPPHRGAPHATRTASAGATPPRRDEVAATREHILIARPGAPFCAEPTVRAAIAGRYSELTFQQTGPIERLRVRDHAEHTEADALARGLAPDHPAIVGVRRFLAPNLDRVLAVVTDVDGTLTDGRIWFDGKTIDTDPAGEPARAFDTQDGLGMRLLIEAGVGLGVLSSTLRGESSRQRMSMLGVEHVDIAPGHKAERFLALCQRLGTDPANVLYFGDDLNDEPAMRLAGLVACPADAHPQVRAAADLVLDAPGGRHAFRELADLLLSLTPHPAAAANT